MEAITNSIPANESELEKYLDDLDTRVEVADEAVRWALYCRYTKQPGPDVGAAESVRASFLLDDALWAVLNDWANRAVSDRARRRLQLWKKLATAAKIRDVAPIRDLRTELNKEIVGFKPVVAGETVTRTGLQEILRTDSNRERRRLAWLAFDPSSEQLDPRVRELLRGRNQQAQALGSPTYVDLSLELDGLTRRDLEDLFEWLEKVTRPEFERLLREGAARNGLEAVEPWDLQFVMNRSHQMPDHRFPRSEMTARLEVMRRRIGVPDGLPIRFEFTEVPFGGLTNFIKIPSDIRILMNAADGHKYYNTLFHEYGHAVHNSTIGERSFILQKESGPYSESMAETMAYFAIDPGWLNETASITGTEVDDFWTARKSTWLTRFRSLLASATFEHLAYSNPDADLDDLLAQCESRYLLTHFQRASRWASDSFYSIYPIYLHNYIVADVVASQIHAALHRELNECYGNPQTFAWLADRLYAPGASKPWRSLIKEATGSDLNPEFLASDLQRPRLKTG